MQLVNARKFNRKLQGIEVELITLKNKNGMTMQVTNYGGRIVSLFVPNKQGQWNDVLLGYDNIDAYLEDPYYMGALVGRYANRIDGGRFSLFGKEYQ
ncbi:MAG: galactose-1-epimerase, partial [Caldisericaceae bacterium]|nr:galactose-1-epimerase [Caldisericaceae bacterium]